MPTEGCSGSPSNSALFGKAGKPKPVPEGVSSGPQAAPRVQEWRLCWVSARREEFASSNVLPGITKARLPTAREKKVLPASWASAQPEAAVYLAPVPSQHTGPCSWGLSVLQSAWPGHRAWPPHALPGALHKAAPHPPARLTYTQEGIIHSCLHLTAGHTWAVSSTTLTKVSHPASASNQARSTPFAPGRPPSSGAGTVYWIALEEFGFTDISSAP